MLLRFHKWSFTSNTLSGGRLSKLFRTSEPPKSRSGVNRRRADCAAGAAGSPQRRTGWRRYPHGSNVPKEDLPMPALVLTGKKVLP
jgi:hypothetical protein